MKTETAQQVANLLNARNRLAVEYTAAKVLEHAERYIVHQDEHSGVIGVVEVKKVQWYQCEIDHLSAMIDGRGIGTLLLAQALKRGKDLGARIAQCTIRTDNAGSEALLFFNGFERFPVAEHLAGSFRFHIAKNVWMAVDEFIR